MTVLPRRLAAALAGLALLAMPLAALPAAADTIVFAAASLKESLGAAVKAYEAKTGEKVAVSYAGSSQLARQIEAGAPADLFISADLDWMDELAKKDLIDSASRVTLLGNTLVLVAPKASTASLAIGPGFPLAEALGADGKLAMAAVASVPAGKYGKAALGALGVWRGVEGKVARAENVRAALALVERGEAPFGIVYATDARASTKVRIIGAFPPNTHPPITYPIATLKTSTNPQAEAFRRFLLSREGKAIFARRGFVAR